MEGVTNVIPGPHSHSTISSSQHTELTLQHSGEWPPATTAKSCDTELSILSPLWVPGCSDWIIRTPSRTSEPIRILAAGEVWDVTRYWSCQTPSFDVRIHRGGGMQTRKYIVWLLCWESPSASTAGHLMDFHVMIKLDRGSTGIKTFPQHSKILVYSRS